ncbi:ubiquinol-cytochrome c reductase iron-sulfur subunit [Mechercharimyces sp. CAU 1602]|uniref:ubiquinol-cytochrome c reductase iron-sulfur subunit n=1 Tax=Mechercharimyces sp. CAU 1602 TaxID=2973933 RepID=UPI0021611AF9|nr:ubiquinol-cytochrome c reductase iron-sulfur subunit [Mechercharimyces sp. CAU 1602]MCS1351001.1 ubiquinol-cytochrome c reductase iron-sulfur subunit [Mechercharimyces sp. CAU 1602]
MSTNKKRRLSRRQFLINTLAGSGAFMGAGMLYPMVRFAIDPILQKETQSSFVEVGAVEEFGKEPIAIQFFVEQKDGWYQKEGGTKMTAWVMKQDDGKFLALSPICKHLGCTVKWEGSPEFKDEFYCPCHGGRYTDTGINIPGTPPLAPLDKYKTEVKNGKLFLGSIVPQEGGA